MSVAHAMLCGDEIKSAVVDLGSSSCRFGTAGQDMPRHVFRTDIGSIVDDSASRTIIGDGGLRYLNKNMHTHTPSTQSDLKWDDVEKLLKYGIGDCMRLSASETPLFLADNPLLGGCLYGKGESDLHKRKTIETCFESVGSPALYMGNSAILSAFSMGRINSLVIDIGSAGTSVTPVVEGYALKKSSVYTSRGGNLLDSVLYEEIQRSTGAAVRPWFESGKTGGAFVDVTPSFREIHVRDVVRDVKAWMCFVPHNPLVPPSDCTSPASVSRYRQEELQRRLLHLPPPYELPDGTMVTAGESICTVPERVFFPSAGAEGFGSFRTGGLGGGGTVSQGRKRTRQLLDATFGADTADAGNNSNSCSSNNSVAEPHSLSAAPAVAPADSSLMGRLGGRVDQEALSDLVYAAVAQADPDVRRELLGNIHIVGGGALIQGLSNRLSYELGNTVPSHMKVKLVGALPVERHHAAWVGASILGICGSFQQLWLTKQEYDELGAERAALRFDH